MSKILTELEWDEIVSIDSMGNHPMLFYSGDDGLARNLWSKLPLRTKQRSFILYGGAYDWYHKILYPKLPITVSDPRDLDIQETVMKLSEYYGGQAKFDGSRNVLDYYFKDLTNASWPKSKRHSTLVRRGC